ncbi:hypothetical protein YC2023_099152 [Brassica napus]
METIALSLQIATLTKDHGTVLGKCGFSLAYILLFSERSCIVTSRVNLRYLPIWYKTSSTELTLRLIRNGQADAVCWIIPSLWKFNILLDV